MFGKSTPDATIAMRDAFEYSFKARGQSSPEDTAVAKLERSIRDLAESADQKTWRKTKFATNMATRVVGLSENRRIDSRYAIELLEEIAREVYDIVVGRKLPTYNGV